jgi:hypothetical protein
VDNIRLNKRFEGIMGVSSVTMTEAQYKMLHDIYGDEIFVNESPLQADEDCGCSGDTIEKTVINASNDSGVKRKKASK